MENLPWWNSAAFWTAFFTFALTVSTILLWFSTRESVKFARRSLSDLERPYIFVHEISSLQRAEYDFAVIKYSVGNYGKLPAVIERLSVGMWSGETTSMTEMRDAFVNDPAIIRGIFPAGFSQSDVVYDIENLDIRGSNPEYLYPSDAIQEALFFRVIINYSGPFTKGHVTSCCWQYDIPTGLFVVLPDKALTYLK